MLYLFHDKIYIKPFSTSIVEVKVDKDKNGYDVKPLKSPLEVTPEQLKELVDITIDEAYKYQTKIKEPKEKKEFF